MLGGSGSQWRSVEQWSPTLFLTGGALLVGHAAITAVKAFTDLTPPPDLFVTTGHLIALVGLIGLYPVLVDRTPRLARAAVMVAVIPIVGWVGMTTAQFLTAVGSVSSLEAFLPGAFIMLVVVSTILTYVLFGAATFRVSDGSRSVGLLVVAPAFVIAIMLIDTALTGLSAVDGVLVAAGLALSVLTLGYKLRAWEYRSDHAAPSGEATLG